MEKYYGMDKLQHTWSMLKMKYEFAEMHLYHWETQSNTTFKYAHDNLNNYQY